MYWTLKSIPELHDLPPQQRRLIWNAARAKRWERRPYLAKMFPLMLIIIGIKVLKNAHSYTRGEIGGIIAGLAVVLVFYYQWRITRLRLLTWEFIPDLCPKCGRQVSRGSESCPGCRAAIPPNPTPIHQRSLAPAPADGFYWTRKSIPELQNLSKDERDRIWKAVINKAGLRWDVIVASLALAAAPIVAGEIIAPGLPTGIYLLCMFLGVALALLFYFQWQVSILRPLMWEYLPGLCPHCGYNLRESPQRCPECGAEIVRISA